MQEKLLIDGVACKQPDKFTPNWATTYDDGSGRPITGQAIIDPLFTVESYEYEVSDLSKEEAAAILQKIVPRPSKPTFKLRYFSWFYGKWRTDEFYVGQGSMEAKTLEVNGERLSSISCNMIGVNPI